ncbi:MAG: hypothetical protein LC117_05710 [Bacteroidia bacterium]|nr:hypothetical protein [Bacteroidia bacterium]MCZ2277407.1 hypothetical protein [Bacteroidia bacterium]
MNNEEFDRLLHSRLSRLKIKPPAEIWDKIASRTSAKKGVAWWWIPVVLILISVPAGLYWISKKPLAENGIVTSKKIKNDGKALSYSTKHPQSVVPLPESVPAAGNQQTKKQSRPRIHTPQSLQSVPFVTTQIGVNLSEAQMQSALINEDFKPDPEAVTLTNLLLTVLPETASLSAATVKTITPLTGPGKTFSILALGGPQWATKLLGSKRDLPGDKRYISFRNNAEKRADAWTAALLIQVDLDRNFFIRTGIHYHRIRENIALRYIRTLLNGEITDTVIGTKIPNGDPDAVLALSEDDQYKILADYILQDEATYQFISFPLIAGAGIKSGKFSFYATAGLALNFRSSYQGKILAPDSVYLISIKDAAGSPFVPVTGLTFMTSAGVSYLLSQKVEFVIEPTYVHQLPDITKSSYRLSQRFYGFGIQTGLKVKF